MCLYRDCTKRVLGGRELSFQGAEIEKKNQFSGNWNREMEK